MKNSKFFLTIFILSLFATFQNNKAVIEIKKEYISTGIGLLACGVGLYKNEQIDYEESTWEEAAYKSSAVPATLLGMGGAIILNTLLCSTKISKKEILNYLISLLALGVGSKLLISIDRARKETREGMYNGIINWGLIGSGVGLIGTNFINYLESVYKVI